MLRKSLIFLGEKIVWNFPYINASFFLSIVYKLVVFYGIFALNLSS